MEVRAVDIWGRGRISGPTAVVETGVTSTFLIGQEMAPLNISGGKGFLLTKASREDLGHRDLGGGYEAVGYREGGGGIVDGGGGGGLGGDGLSFGDHGLQELC